MTHFPRTSDMGDEAYPDTADPREAADQLRAVHQQHVHRGGCHRWFDHNANEMLDLAGPAGWCDGCGQDWPCDTTRALNRAFLATEPSAGVTSEAATLDVAALNRHTAELAQLGQNISRIATPSTSTETPTPDAAERLAYVQQSEYGAMLRARMTMKVNDQCPFRCVGTLVERDGNLDCTTNNPWHRIGPAETPTRVVATTPSVSDEGLDVERLARAMVGALNFYVLPPRVVGDPFWRERAEAIAAEYAALATTSEKPVSG